MSDPNERFYWGDFRLADHAIDHDGDADGEAPQEFTGVDQIRRLVIPGSPNDGFTVGLRALLNSGSGAASRRAFRARHQAMLAALTLRRRRQDPLIWVEDTTRSKVVTSYATGTLTTSAAHGLATGDVVLIRRLGAGLFTLATFTSTAPTTGTLVAVTGGQIHAIAALDEVHLVEAYWIGMTLASKPKVPPQDGDHWGVCEFAFRGSGRYLYSRTSTSVGS